MAVSSNYLVVGLFRLLIIGYHLSFTIRNYSSHIFLGPEWIYNTQLMNGPLMALFRDGDLSKLKSLKLQQVNNEKMLYEILRNCSNLLKLEIREPSIVDQHLNKIANQLSSTRFKLQELTLPSSVRNSGLFDCFKMFTNLKSLSISNFEPVLDYLDDETDVDQMTTDPTTQQQKQQYISQLKKQLEQLNKLAIINPMGENAVERIVNYCPNINELNLEVQEIMHLKPICKLKSLKSLSIHNSPNLPLSFTECILPILECIGGQFVSLSLEQFPVLDLVEINKLCPVLHSFSAQWFTLLSVGRTPAFRLFNDSLNLQFAMSRRAPSPDSRIRRQKSRDNFPNLQLLRLRPRLNSKLSSLAIEYIIRGAKQLQYLELYCCKQFDDALFAHLFKLNKFKELKYLIIRNCNDLNRTTIARLLSQSENLIYLELDEPVLSKTELLPNSDDPVDLNIVL